ncbi:MAG: SDR family NAD(P)-dependent oxidoreductase [Anaerolineaceae bacterium]|nr:SDR family NAD(P)-dependent oxidoreductase [Anaerolineaceae bacterium]
MWSCIKYEIKAMLKNDTGAIVNNSSMDNERGYPFGPAFSAAKYGVIGLIKSTAIQYIKKRGTD